MKRYYKLKTLVPNQIEVLVDIRKGTKVVINLEKLPDRIKVTHRGFLATGKEFDKYTLREEINPEEEFLNLKAYMQWYNILKSTYQFTTARHGIDYAIEEDGIIKYYSYKSKEAKEKFQNLSLAKSTQVY